MNSLKKIKSEFAFKWLMRKRRFISWKERHWPLVPKYLLDESRKRLIEQQRKQADAEIKFRQGLDEILPKLCNVALVTPMGYTEDFRLVLDFRPELMRDAFMWGNDDHMMKAVCDQVSYHVYRELKTCNLRRFNEVPERPIRYTKW